MPLKRNTGTKRLLDPATLERGADEIAELARQAGVSVALTGGFALQIYGSPRLTGDVDFVAGAILPNVPTLGSLSFGGIKTESPSGVPVDLIVRDDDVRQLYETAHSVATVHDELGFKIIDPEYIVAMKFYAGRRTDLEDVAYLVTSEDLDLPLARRIVRRHLGVYAAKELDAFVAEERWRKGRG